MRFLKENSYDIVRLIINQIGITIFSWVLYSAIASTEIESIAKILVSVFSTLFFFALIYCAAWEYGAKDKVKIDTGRLQYNRYKGFLLGLYANSLNIFFALLDVALMGIFIASGIEGFKTVYGIIDMLIRFTEGMYLGAIVSAIPAVSDITYLLQSLLFAIAPLLAVAAVNLGYLFGVKDIRIFGAFSIKNKNK